MSTDTFAGLPIAVPLWRGATLEQLENIDRLIDEADYHFADDLTDEWEKAYAKLDQAARLVNDLALCFYAIERIFNASPRLTVFPAFVDAVLADARKRRKREAQP